MKEVMEKLNGLGDWASSVALALVVALVTLALIGAMYAPAVTLVASLVALGKSVVAESGMLVLVCLGTLAALKYIRG